MDIKKLLLDRKLFLISIGIFFVGVVILLFCGQINSSEDQLKAEDILDVPITRPKVEFPLVFNVIDTDFNDNEKEVLQSCADNWQYETKGLVNIVFNFDWSPPIEFDEVFYEAFPQKTIWKRKSNKEEVLLLLLKSNLVADGVSIGNFIMVIDDYLDPLSEQKFRAIVMHELGHQLALEHINPKYPALMNLNLNIYNSQITKYDLIVLHSIYNSSK